MFSTVRFGAAQPHYQTPDFSGAKKTNNTATQHVSVDTIRFGNSSYERLDLPNHLANVLDGLLMEERNKPEFGFEEKRAAAVQHRKTPCSEQEIDKEYMQAHQYKEEAHLVTNVLIRGIKQLIASEQITNLPTLSVKERLAIRHEARPGLRFHYGISTITGYGATPQLNELLRAYAPAGYQDDLLKAAILVQDPKRK